LQRRDLRTILRSQHHRKLANLLYKFVASTRRRRRRAFIRRNSSTIEPKAASTDMELDSKLAASWGNSPPRVFTSVELAAMFSACDVDHDGYCQCICLRINRALLTNRLDGSLDIQL
jgi:hypothetical protein